MFNSRPPLAANLSKRVQNSDRNDPVGSPGGEYPLTFRKCASRGPDLPGADPISPSASVEAKAACTWEQRKVYENIILPLITSYPELSALADGGVAVTQEKPGDVSAEHSWTHLLAKDNKITPPCNGEKYIELERTLSSLVYFTLFLEGGTAAYEKLVSVQTDEDKKLSWVSFEIIHQQAKRVVAYYGDSVVEALLVYSDLGKSTIYRDRTERQGIKPLPDHDDWLEQVLALSPGEIGNLFPSFSRLSGEAQQALVAVTKGVAFHFGHGLHLEGGSRMFEPFVTAVKRAVVTAPLLDLALLVQLSDVAAAASQVTIQGSLTLTEECFVGYNIVYSALSNILKGAQAIDALNYCVAERAKLIGIETTRQEDQIIIRLACMLRIYDQESALRLSKAFQQLDSGLKDIIMEQFSLMHGVNCWVRNPTYMPAVLLNLAKKGARPEESTAHVLNGLACIARLLRRFQADYAECSQPLCFNHLAGRVAANKAKFFLDARVFNPDEFSVNDEYAIVPQA